MAQTKDMKLTLEEAKYMRDLFALFVTKKPIVNEIIEIVSKHEAYQLHGDEIGSKLQYESGYIRPIIKKMVAFGLLLVKPGESKQHRAKYYGVNYERVEELKAVYGRFKQK